MGSLNLLERLRQFIGKWSFNIFIWSIRMTREEYWREIYRQEKNEMRD